jgi:hypothetical protein
MKMEVSERRGVSSSLSLIKYHDKKWCAGVKARFHAFLSSAPVRCRFYVKIIALLLDYDEAKTSLYEQHWKKLRDAEW